jgi:RHS repeat-associated protein
VVQTSFTDATNTYQYDGAGNRMSANRSGVVTRYLLNRNSPLAQVLAETDASSNVIYYYIYGVGLVSRIDAGGNAQYYHYDSRGSTIALTDATGKITEAYAYDPFGRPINGQLSDNRFRYLGRHGVMDEENGLLYIRARYYSTKRGRFITKDPTTGKDGDSQSMNRYIYALNNPVKLIDMSGLSPLESTSQLNQNGTSDQQHQNLIDSHHLTPQQAAIILQSQQAALNYELQAIHYEEEANILQGVYDALQTTEGLLTGNWLGVASGLSHQLSTLADITGHNNTALVLNVAGTAGDIFGIGQEIQGGIQAAGTLQSSLISNGGDLLQSGAANVQATEDLISPIVSHGVDFIRVEIWGQ